MSADARRSSSTGGTRGTLPASALSVLLATAGLCACSSLSRTICLAPDGPNAVSIAAAATANQDRAVAIDLVFVTDETVAAEIAKLSARDYFARRTQLLRDNPETLHLTSWELAPGQSVTDQAIDAPCASQAALVFVDYATPGEHRLRVDGVSHLSLTLGASDFTAQAG